MPWIFLTAWMLYGESSFHLTPGASSVQAAVHCGFDPPTDRDRAKIGSPLTEMPNSDAKSPPEKSGFLKRWPVSC